MEYIQIVRGGGEEIAYRSGGKRLLAGIGVKRRGSEPASQQHVGTATDFDWERKMSSERHGKL